MPLGSPPATPSAARGRVDKPAAADLLGTMSGRARERDPSSPVARALTVLREQRVAVGVALVFVAVALVGYAMAHGHSVWVLVGALVLALAYGARLWSRTRARRADFTNRATSSHGRAAVTPDVTTHLDDDVAQRTADAGAKPEPVAQATPVPGLALKSITTRGRLSKRSALIAAAAVCQDVTTPAARALVAGAELARLTLPPVAELTVRPWGASALIKQTEVTVGHAAVFADIDDALRSNQPDSPGRTVLVGWDGQAQAVFVLVDAD